MRLILPVATLAAVALALALLSERAAAVLLIAGAGLILITNPTKEPTR